MSLDGYVILWLIVAVVGAFLLFANRMRWLRWNGKLVVILYLFLLLVIARLAVNYHGSFDEKDDIYLLENNWERFPDGIVHALQSFSMDEDYTFYTSKGKKLFQESYGEKAGQIYVLVISVLNVFAPIIGGAVLLDILIGVFPRARLFLWTWRRKVVFSEINEASVTLAEDLYSNRNYRKVFCWVKLYQLPLHLPPLLVFTDAYPDKESENRSELFERARALRAVCIKEDLQHLNLRWSRSVHYMLMDEQEEKSIIALAELLKRQGIRGRRWPKGKETVENGEMKSRRKKENREAREKWNKKKAQKTEDLYNRWLKRKDKWNDEKFQDKKEAWKKEFSLTEQEIREEYIKYSQWKRHLKKLSAESKEGKAPFSGFLENLSEESAGSSDVPVFLEEWLMKVRKKIPESEGTYRQIRMPKPPLCPKTEAPKDPRTRVYIFCQDEQSLDLINDLYAESPHKNDILVRPIRDYFNMAVSQMYEVPLFLPLLGKKEGQSAKVEVSDREEGKANAADKKMPSVSLHVAILGGGAIAEDVFRAVFWCGQMEGIQLHIHIVAENGPELQKRIQVKCPELIASCKAGNEILRWSEKAHESGSSNPPYAIIDGWDRALNAEDPVTFRDTLLEKADYYVVALGEDKKNIHVTKMLARELSRSGLSQSDHPRTRPVIIAPVIFEPHMAEAVKRLPKQDSEPSVVPFGMMTDRFSCRNVFMSTFTEGALKSDSMYNTVAHKKRQKDEYTYWANVIRAVHAPYKLFALGILEKVLLGKPEEERFVIAGSGEVSGDQREQIHRVNDLRFRRMEHRRWNAYMRTQGFRCASGQEHETYYRESGGKGHKDLKRKLHNCLVECSMQGNELPVNPDTGDPLREKMDALDLVSLRAALLDCEKNLDTFDESVWKGSEYKQYDGISGDDQVNRILERCGWEKWEEHKAKKLAAAKEAGASEERLKEIRQEKNPAGAWEQVYVKAMEMASAGDV